MEKLFKRLDKYEDFDLKRELEKLPEKPETPRKTGERKRSDSGIENDTSEQRYDSWQSHLNRQHASAIRLAEQSFEKEIESAKRKLNPEKSVEKSVENSQKRCKLFDLRSQLESDDEITTLRKNVLKTINQTINPEKFKVAIKSSKPGDNDDDQRISARAKRFCQSDTVEASTPAKIKENTTVPVLNDSDENNTSSNCCLKLSPVTSNLHKIIVPSWYELKPKSN